MYFLDLYSTNTLAAKTASMAGPQTMFEMCSETRRRLRRVNGYDRFIGEPPFSLDPPIPCWGMV